ncbi:hypothetical protein [Mariniflexile maritimum]|uniref:hypothetical protein n=1 Tax=Mariniflexile maritimum TaxID=2682493 RepID=UPI0012F68C89|nr:hypothetical protein [Mariniflexile maritimum]
MKHAIFIIGLLAFISCKDKNQQETSTQNTNSEATHQHHQNETSTVYQNSWTADMQLNNGGKWPANIETNEGVENMKNILKTQPTITIEDYHQLAAQLNDAKNDVVKKCTMEGPSHDYLHVWLVPLIEKIEVLSETKNSEDAAKIKSSIVENINMYSNYFQ